MTEAPKSISLRPIYDEIERIEAAVKAHPVGRDNEQAVADLLRALDKLKADVKVLCQPTEPDRPSLGGAAGRAGSSSERCPSR